MTAVLLFANALPETIMHSWWVEALTAFVAINTVVYLTLAVVKLLPKIYLSDWIHRPNRRSETRSIFPDVDAETPRSG